MEQNQDRSVGQADEIPDRLSHWDVASRFIQQHGRNLRLVGVRDHLVQVSESGACSQVIPLLMSFIAELQARALKPIDHRIEDSLAWAAHNDIPPNVDATQARRRRIVEFYARQAFGRAFTNAVLDLVRRSGLIARGDQGSPEEAFFAGYLVFAADARSQKSVLFDAYREWVSDLGAKPISKKTFRRKLLGWSELRGLPVGEERDPGARYWVGVRLADSAQQDVVVEASDVSV